MCKENQMSALTEISKTVVNAQKYTSDATSNVSFSVTSESGLASGQVVQAYVQVGDALPVLTALPNSFVLGDFDENTTTFVVGVVQDLGAAAVQVYANEAGVGAPPLFTLAAQLPIVGSLSPTQVFAKLSRNGLVCVVANYFNNNNAGLLAVFTRPAVSGQAWTQVATVNGDANSGLGSDISISASGTVIAVGAYAGVGSANIYYFNTATNTLTFIDKVVGTGAVGDSNQGWSVGLSGNGRTVAVGGSSDNSGRGAVWVFNNNARGTWTQAGPKLSPFNSTYNGNSGQSVSLSYDGTRLAIAAVGNSLVQQSGSVFMYNLVTSAWVQGQTIYPVGTNGYGIVSVNLSDDGNIVVFDLQGDNGGRGGVLVYNRESDGRWVQNGLIRVATSTLVTPLASVYLGGSSPTGSMFAAIAQADPVVFTIFQ